ncbi:MAG: KH domain-containing protein [Erysipelotrichaceae bacterium]|nr:KH domain-containing protein [Erysipelotrichaceae bacterium]
MIDLEKVLLNLVKPICNDPDAAMVKQMDSLDKNEILLYVYAPSEDIARLIGRQGVMANSIRQMLQVASKIENKHISIKFEAL